MGKPTLFLLLILYCFGSFASKLHVTELAVSLHAKHSYKITENFLNNPYSYLQLGPGQNVPIVLSIDAARRLKIMSDKKIFAYVYHPSSNIVEFDEYTDKYEYDEVEGGELVFVGYAVTETSESLKECVKRIAVEHLVHSEPLESAIRKVRLEHCGDSSVMVVSINTVGVDPSWRHQQVKNAFDSPTLRPEMTEDGDEIYRIDFLSLQ